MSRYKGLQIGDRITKYPLLQGGMGVGVSLSGLAGSVAYEGGVGVISTAQIGFRDSDFPKDPLRANLKAIKTELSRARKIAPEGVIGFNIMTATKNYKEYVKAALEAKADLIISGAGLPVELPAFAEGFSTKIAPIVSSCRAAKILLNLWDKRYHRAPDLLIAEGPRAGGHLGFSYEELHPVNDAAFEAELLKLHELKKVYEDKYGREIPLIAAGGIFDNQDVKHMMDEIGVDGVQIGTRFVTSLECDAPMSFKQQYLDAKASDIVITKSPVGMPGRALKNAFLRKIQTERPKIEKCYQCLEKCRPSEIPYCITQALTNAVSDRTEDGLIFCGSNAWRCTRIEKVKEIIEDLFGCACNPN